MLNVRYMKYEHVKTVLFGNQVQSESILWLVAKNVGDFLVSIAGNEHVLDSADVVKQTIEDLLLSMKRGEINVPTDILQQICGCDADLLVQGAYDLIVRDYMDTPKVSYVLMSKDDMAATLQPTVDTRVQEDFVDYERQAELLADRIVDCISTEARERYPDDKYKTALLFAKQYYQMEGL